MGGREEEIVGIRREGEGNERRGVQNAQWDTWELVPLQLA